MKKTTLTTIFHLMVVLPCLDPYSRGPGYSGTLLAKQALAASNSHPELSYGNNGPGRQVGDNAN